MGSACEGDHSRLGNERAEPRWIECVELANGDVAHLAAVPLQLRLIAQQDAILEAEPHLVGQRRDKTEVAAA
jgi:hypothetical protein